MSKLYLHYFKRKGDWETDNIAVILDTQDIYKAIELCRISNPTQYDYDCVPVASGLFISAEGYDKANLDYGMTLT